jgi:hypothetical protein
MFKNVKWVTAIPNPSGNTTRFGEGISNRGTRAIVESNRYIKQSLANHAGLENMLNMA